MLTLRPFDRSSQDDRRRLVALQNHARPYEPLTEAYLLREPVPAGPSGRWMIEEAGIVIGYARYRQPPHRFKPGRFSLDLALIDGVDRARRESAFDAVLAALQAMEPTELVIRAVETETERREILEARGFTVSARFASCALDLSTFDVSRQAQHLAQVLGSGIRIVSYATQQADDPGLLARLWELEWEIEQDIPGPDTMTKISLEEFRTRFDRPAFLPEGYLIAIEAGVPVGVSSFVRNARRETRLAIGLTGTARAYRRRGIATALKLRGIELACAWGIETIETSNEETNPMRKINEALGFVPAPGVVIYTRAS